MLDERISGGFDETESFVWKEGEVFPELLEEKLEEEKTGRGGTFDELLDELGEEDLQNDSLVLGQFPLALNEQNNLADFLGHLFELHFGHCDWVEVEHSPQQELVLAQIVAPSLREDVMEDWEEGLWLGMHIMKRLINFMS